MLPEPLHPSVVHFPIVLGLLLPVLAAWVLWRLHDGAPVRTWTVVALVAVLSWTSGFVAERTGGDEEERVEEVLADHEPIHEHEEAAELFVLLSGATAVLTILGFAPGIAGRGLRVLALVGALGAAGAVVRTGMLGGELVYEHGAAAAYTGAAPTQVPAPDAAPPDQDEPETAQ